MVNKQLERLSKKIHKIRIVLGYATNEQIEKGWGSKLLMFWIMGNGQL